MARRRLLLKLGIAAAPSVLILVALVLWFAFPPSPGPGVPERQGESTTDRDATTGAADGRADVESPASPATSDGGSVVPQPDPAAGGFGLLGTHFSHS